MALTIRFLEYIRYHIFWFKDFLFGSKIKKHLSDIDFILSNYTSPESEELRHKYLNSLLSHVNRTTKFYKAFTGKPFEDYPIVNKNIVRDNIDDFKSSVFVKKKNKLILTSGSTGAVLKIHHDKNKVLRNSADTIYFASKAYFKIGYKLIYMRHWLDYYKKNRVIAWLQNITSIEALNLNQTNTELLMKNLRKDTSNKVWQGYSSAFENICKQLDIIKSEPIHIPNLKSIITMSEGLNNFTKEKLKYYFNEPVVSRYSNMENGIIAQQGIEKNSDFEINWASYFVEILKLDEDKPVKSGELGRIVITDLFNYATPLIRYDTGDIGTVDFNSSPPAFKKIEGRKTDIILNTKGDMVSSFIMMNTYTYRGIKQSQLIQEKKKEYTLKLNVEEDFNQEKDIVKQFMSFLGKDAKITIKYVDEIPLLSSGKRKTTINNYTKNLNEPLTDKTI